MANSGFITVPFGGRVQQSCCLPARPSEGTFLLEVYKIDMNKKDDICSCNKCSEGMCHVCGFTPADNGGQWIYRGHYGENKVFICQRGCAIMMYAVGTIIKNADRF